MSSLDTSVLDSRNSFSKEENDILARSTYDGEDFSLSEDEKLVDSNDLLTSDRDIRKNKWLNLTGMLVIGGVFAVLALICFSMFGSLLTAGRGGQKISSEQQEEDTEIETLQERIKELEGKIEQQDVALAYNPNDTSEWEKIESNEERIEAESVEQPEPTKTSTQTVQPVSRANSNANPQPAPQPKINPLDQWAMLSALGTANGENYTEKAIQLAEEVDVEQSSPPYTEEAIAATNNQENIPPAQPPSPAIQPVVQVQDTMSPPLGLESGKTAKIASIAIGRETDSLPSNSGLEEERLSLQNSEIVNLLSRESSDQEYLREKKESYRRSYELKSERSVDNNSSRSNTGNVPLGSQVKGELATNIVWSQGIPSNQARGIIYLKESLYDENGAVALKANASLIVEVASVNSSGLAQLNVVAVSYENNEGRLVQEALPTEGILIQGKNGALVARRSNGSGGSNFGQDLLLGGLGAGERAFDLINEPETRGSISRDFNSSSDDRFFESDRFQSESFFTRRSNNSSLATGAAEGAFGTVKDRLEDRSDQMNRERLNQEPIYQLDAGTEVLVFVNSFIQFY